MSMEKPENLELTPTSEIRNLASQREQGVLTRLPSGIVVMLRQPDLSKMILEGIIPNDLLSLATGTEASTSFDPKNAKRGLELMGIIIKNSLVSPRVVDENPQDNEILASDLSEADRAFIVNRGQEGVASLKPFRRE